MRKPKTVEITLRVRVPANWSAAHARKQVAGNWYGEIYADGREPFEQVSLFPRWGKARVVKPGEA